jgi:hypothetical protein
VTRAEGSVGAIKNRPLSGVPSKAAKHAAATDCVGNGRAHGAQSVSIAVCKGAPRSRRECRAAARLAPDPCRT